ncbi:MAG: hypothetical protein ACD_9C00069G0001 [uncultured bacterium]|nr:MAG: hypothetical protein ACD_9C00069G0001 [uncultured bacterium]
MIFDLYDEEDVRLIRDAFAGKIVGLTSGSFDMFHAMHEHYLQCCRRHCGHDGVLIVGIDSDHLIRQRKGPQRPVIPETDRLQAIAGRKGVAAAFILGTVEDFGRATEILGAKFIFKNQEYEKVTVLGAELPGVELVIVPDFQRTESTTKLIKKIIETHSK